MYHAWVCLACDHHPSFPSKLDAALHVRDEHKALLEHRHELELIVGTAWREQPSAEVGHHAPYVCIHCGGDTDFAQEGSAKIHVRNIHHVPDDAILYLTDYASRDDWQLAVAREQEARDFHAHAEAERFAAKLGPICGVRDFLTECGV